MDPEQLHDFCTDADPFVEGLVQACARHGIDTPVRQAAFLAQLAHESGAFKHLEENLNYGVDALLKVFPLHFTAAEVENYARKPEAIANRVYAGRLGNGDEASGDGWNFRGRGLIQITGRANYTECSQALYSNATLVDVPSGLGQPLAASLSAGWFWKKNGLSALADANTDDAFQQITRRINGGLAGLPDRQQWWRRAKQVLGV